MGPGTKQASYLDALTKNAPYLPTNLFAKDDFTELLSLALLVTGYPHACISFPGKKQYWSHAADAEPVNTHHHNSFTGQYDFGVSKIIEVEDTLADALFSAHSLVTGQPFIRSFFSMAVLDPDHRYQGNISVMSCDPGILSAAQVAAMEMVVSQAQRVIELKAQIAELDAAAEEARDTEDFMNAIFHNAIDGVVVLDEKGRILQWNPQAEYIFGWRQEEVFARYFHKVALPHHCHDEHLQMMQEYQETGGQTLSKSKETLAKRKDNAELHITLSISSVYMKGLQFFICFISDITERKLAAMELDKQKKFYESILNALPSDIAVFDPDHKYLFVNPGAIKDPVHREFIVGKDDFDYCAYRNRDISLAQLRREMFLEIKRTQKEITWEDTVKDPNGKPFTSLRRIFPVFNESRELTMVIGYGVDITDRKIMEEKQNTLVKQLSSQNTQLVDFCNIVSHNLRAPLVNMSMLVEYIKEAEDIEEKDGLIQELQPVIDNLHATFNELVESIQIKQNIEINAEDNLLEDCVSRVLASLSGEIRKTDAEVQYDFSQAPVIRYPQKYILSIFLNLMSNALKYHAPGRRPLIKLSTQKLEDGTLLKVADNGLGIDLDKHKDNIFKIGKVFHRHPNAKGFGLFMTKTQVEAMGGKIWVESTAGEGATFFIEFKD